LSYGHIWSLTGYLQPSRPFTKRGCVLT